MKHQSSETLPKHHDAWLHPYFLSLHWHDAAVLKRSWLIKIPESSEQQQQKTTHAHSHTHTCALE